MPTTVADVMTRDPIAVMPETPLNDAIKLLAERQISGLPVVSQGKLVGVLSESDLMWRESGVTPPPYIMILDSVIYLKNPAQYERDLHKALGQTVGEVMTKDKDLVTALPDLSLRKAAQIIHDRNVRRLLVTDADGSLIGIVTKGDIVRFMASHPDD